MDVDSLPKILQGITSRLRLGKFNVGILCYMVKQHAEGAVFLALSWPLVS